MTLPHSGSPPVTFRHAAAGIDWHCESRGQGPVIVLVPSGEGDCASFEKTAATLARDFTVLTFDTPGFSRTSAPPDFDGYTTTRAAHEVAALLRSLRVGPATIYGCSSGGQIALCLVADHPDLVHRAVVHEVPLWKTQWLAHLLALDDAGVVAACQGVFRDHMNEDAAAWDALGPVYHARLAKNYITWVRRYLASPDLLRAFTREELHRRPVTWTLGGLTPVFAFYDNIVTAHEAGLPLGMLMCRHFPQVSIPDALAAHIAGCARA